MTQSQPLQQLLDSLPEEERVILTLHYLRGMSSADIAALLGVNANAVDSVIGAGRTRIFNALGIS